jgi:endonuclease YncB( thermonuclease family)
MWLSNIPDRLSVILSLFGRTNMAAMLLLASAFAHAASTELCDCTYTGKVTKIVDGDTFDLVGEDGLKHRIRPAGFDTPESERPCYREATRFLRHLIYGKVVEARCYKYEPETKNHKRRDICRVSLDGKDLGIEMVQAGMAWHAKAWAHEQRKDERRQYSETEYKAMQEGKGCLWAATYPSVD